MIRKHVHVFLFSFLGIWLSVSARAQVPENKSDDGLMLLSDVEMQIASTDMLNSIYNYDFKLVDEHFLFLKEKYGWHPLPYFLRGLAEWWKIEAEIENESYDKGFIAYMDSSIRIAKGLYRIPNVKLEASFILAASYAFKGRLLAERKSWRKAASYARKSLNYLEECREYNGLSPELQFGDGLYNYFAEWIPDNYPVLRPVMLFFRKGDRTKGIKQLRNVANNAFFTRTEAQYFLLRILNIERKNYLEGLHWSQYLHKSYPNNPVFHRYYARMLYVNGRTKEMVPEAEEILRRIDSGRFGYGSNAGRYAAFFLGDFYSSRMNDERAKFYYLRVLQFVHQNEYFHSGYHLYALLGLEEIALREGDKEQARVYYKKIRKYAKRKHHAYRHAKKVWKAYRKKSRRKRS
ncbi:MAG: tol-pal system protein YbgF [Cytophagales bacterium]|nr:tol-pal system protein YbgF [Cytophagales bacterium]